MTQRTLYRKLWDSHVIAPVDDDPTGRSALIHVDRHLLHECSTHQSFAALRANGRAVRREETHLAVPDHAVSTHTDRLTASVDGPERQQVETLARNARDFGIALIDLDDARQGIVHVIGPELGFTLPGITLACGDSHTSTHGAFGALAFGIGASDCETVMATNAIVQRRADTLEMRLEGTLPPHVTAKDLALALIARFGAGFATGSAIEFTGAPGEAFDMAARMTLCNMAIEFGARIGLVAPDETTVAYLRGRPHAPQGAQFDAAAAYWLSLRSDPGASYDRSITFDVTDLAPQVTWGTNPQEAIGAGEPIPAEPADPAAARQHRQTLAYMGLEAGRRLSDYPIDVVFIGSCTNGRIEDFRAAAKVVAGRKVAPGVRALAVPGSMAVRAEAEAEGIDTVLREAGFEWRMAGCSLCVAMNGETLAPGERCASTSNRNFVGRQGRDARTHLMSPAMAAAAAVAGRIVDLAALETV